jgi:carbon storage regulator
MLLLSRRIGEEIVIGRDIHVMVLDVSGDRVRLGITAPTAILVDRREISERRAERAAKQVANPAVVAPDAP